MHPEHFFKYYTPSTAKVVLATGRVRWSSPLLFSDPFDCYFSLEPKFDFAGCKERHCERFVDLMFQSEEPAFVSGNRFVPPLRAFRRIAHKKSRAEVQSIFQDVYPEMVSSLEAMSRALRGVWRQEIGNYRLFCVCEINDNLLLWAHYTGSHTGAVFQFECIEELDVPLLAAKRVRYSDEAPGFVNEEEWIQGSLGLRAIDPDNDVWIRLVTTKARVWEHEKEWRVISKRRAYENEGYEDCRFVPREISKVFLGCKMCEADKSDILGLLNGPFAHVEVYQAKQNPIMFRLDFERVR
jgi:hypothetical protein